MFHAEQRFFNRLTGRKGWLLRELVGDTFGDDWIASLVVEKAHYFCRDAELLMVEKITSTNQSRQLRICLKALGFDTAYSIRHGRRKTYNV